MKIYKYINFYINQLKCIYITFQFLCSDVTARKLIATYVSPFIVLVHRCAQLLTTGPARCQHICQIYCNSTPTP